MTVYYIVKRYTGWSVSEQEGDRYFVTLRVEAETKRKAQNKAKKIDSRIRFGGMFGDWVMELEELQTHPWIDRVGV